MPANKKIEKNTQLTELNSFDVSNLVFESVSKQQVPNQNIFYKRINIGIQNPDGSIGDLLFQTPKCFSFGVSVNTDSKTNEVTGYSLPISLYNRDGPTDEQKKFVEVFNEITQACKEHLLEDETKDALEKYDLEMANLKDISSSVLWWKKEKGVVVPGSGPTLYPKLITSKSKPKKGVVNQEPEKMKIVSELFSESSGDNLDPLTLIGKHCLTVGEIKFESIYIGTKITLQIKLIGASIELVESGIKCHLNRKKPTTGLIKGNIKNLNDVDDEDVKDKDDDTVKRSGSVPDSDDEDAKDLTKEPVKESSKEQLKEPLKDEKKEPKKLALTKPVKKIQATATTTKKGGK